MKTLSGGKGRGGEGGGAFAKALQWQRKQHAFRTHTGA
jgi:hypothetical protein